MFDSKIFYVPYYNESGEKRWGKWRMVHTVVEAMELTCSKEYSWTVDLPDLSTAQGRNLYFNILCPCCGRRWVTAALVEEESYIPMRIQTDIKYIPQNAPEVESI